MPDALQETWWRDGDLTSALLALARCAGMPAPQAPPTSPPPSGNTAARVGTACALLGLECAEVELFAARSAETLRTNAPAVIPVANGDLLVLVAVRGRHAHLLTPARTIRKVTLDAVRHRISDQQTAPHRADAESVLRHCGIAPRRHARAVEALLGARFSREPVGALFAVRVPPAADFSLQLRDAGVVRWLVALLGAHAAEYTFFLAAWAVIGRTALQGRIDSGMLWAWVLLLAMIVPARMITTWAQGVIAVRAGGLLRQRLLAGILQLDPEEIRHEGAGRFLARAIEIERVESLALSGGFTSLLAVVELAAAAVVLGAGEARVELPLLALWVALAGLLGWRHGRALRVWTNARLAITHDAVEKMIGQRTRLAQQPPSTWHGEEDAQLEAYAAVSHTMDDRAAWLEGFIPRGWFVVAMLGLGPVFLSTRHDPVTLAVSVGGIVLAWRALRRLTNGLAGLSGAVISWHRIAPLFRAAARIEAAPTSAEAPASEIVVTAQDVAFQHPRSHQPVIRGLNVEIRRGEKLLLEGRSGGGKSTLVAMLAGWRAPTAGSLRSGGLDRATLGARRWRRRISGAPQYHDNHILGGPLAYNLLLGRRWPPTDDDLREAETVAREAGLGALLDRMPAGLMQLVGETGWQLSSGERSRVFLCRALLGRADLVILDECFAALDPHSLRQALECGLRRSRSLLVVAHP